MAKFITGDITKHINKMTMAGAIGIFAIFIVDFIDMYFLSILGESELAAAVWFAGVILFMLVSVGIAMMITMWSIVSKVIWKWDIEKAKKTAMNIFYFTFFFSIPITIFWYIYAQELLWLIWAKWQTFEYALSYFRIVLIGLPFLMLWMSWTGLLRGIWDAKMSMMPTLIAGWVNIVLDPIFIFWFDWWIEWAAWATALSRIALFIVAFYWVFKHEFYTFCSCFGIKEDLREILSIFLPAMLTNIATPIWSGYMMRNLSEYGDDAVAGMAVIGRVIPIIFVYIFAMSGAIWSIIWQNYWAWLHDRVIETIKKSIQIATIYVIWIVTLLILWNWFIIDMFNLKWDGAELMKFYSYFMAIFFIFNAIIFVWNATFNVIGKAYLSTIMNILKSLFLLVPLVYILSIHMWFKGILLAEAISVLITGIITLFLLKSSVTKVIAKNQV